MKKKTKTAQLRALGRDHLKHMAALSARVEKLLPVGTRVRWCTWNRGNRHTQYGVVTAHGCWWSEPMRIQVRNDYTDKLTRRGVGSKDFEVIE